jgi:hypothetical protein
MMAQNDRPVALLEMEQQMRLMQEGKAKAYDAGRLIWKTAMSNMANSSEIMHPLWLIWGALTDWVEIKPSEVNEAENTMRRASKEWLSLELEDIEARAAYFDRWVYEEMGYKRKGK